MSDNRTAIVTPAAAPLTPGPAAAHRIGAVVAPLLAAPAAASRPARGPIAGAGALRIEVTP